MPSNEHTRGPGNDRADVTCPSAGGREERFGSLATVRFLTVVNDNLTRWLVIGLGKRAAAAVGTAPALVLAVGTATYVLPFILLAWLAGWLADRFSKRSIVVRAKFAEILIGGLTVLIVGWGAASGPVLGGLPAGLWLLQAAIVLFAVQTALLNPSLIGTIPEAVPAHRLSAANGIFALVSLVATLVGMSVGNWLADATPLAPGPQSAGGVSLVAVGPVAAGILACAVAGWLASLRLPFHPAADPGSPFPSNPVGATLRDIASLARQSRLAAAAAGIVYFWAIGAVVQLNVDQFAFESGATAQRQVVPLLVALVGGIGAGSVLAGRLSRRGMDSESNVDLGLVPVGALLMGVACLALAVMPTDLFTDAVVPGRLVPSLVWLGLLGFGAGLFDVPLEAYLQEQSPPGRLGSVLASTNLLVFGGMLAASIGYYGLRVPIGPPEAARPLLSARGIFALFALFSGGAMLVAVRAAPRATLRILVAGLVHAIWRFRPRGVERVPTSGPLVIVANHLSWLDGFLLPIACPRPIRMVVYGPNIRGRFLNRLADQWRFILFDPHPKSIARALRSIQQGLAQGDCIGIFCEGGISRTGQIMGFKRGLEWLLSRIESPIQPASIDGLWGSVLTFSEGRYFTKWPRRLRRPISLTFGPVLPAGTHPDQARLALQEVACRAVRSRLASRLTAEQAAWAATAEAFDGCCLVRREDRLLSSLRPGDPLYDSLGRQAAALLGIRSEMAPAAHGALATGSAGAADGIPESLTPDAEAVRDRLRAGGFTIWLATPSLVGAVAAVGPGPAWGDETDARPLAVVVMPIAAAAELPAAEAAAAKFHLAFGLEPVVAYAPREVGGLVSMNTPPSRAAGPHEVTCKAGTLGRVVNGVVVWPRSDERARLGLEPLPRDSFLKRGGEESPSGGRLDGGLPAATSPDARSPDDLADTVVVAATASGRPNRPVAEPPVFTLSAPLSVDADGFLTVRGARD
jgi:1-acyl-sn-glycerol-3-phosphate acyltransferase